MTLSSSSRFSIDEIGSIVDLQVAQLAARLAGRRITLDVTEAAKSILALDGYDPAYGARPLRRLIQREIGDQLARMLLAGEVDDGDTVVVDSAELDASAFERTAEVVAAESPRLSLKVADQ